MAGWLLEGAERLPEVTPRDEPVSRVENEAREEAQSYS